MTREQYALAHFMLHEYLVDIDLAGLQIGQCGGRCKGHDEEDVMKYVRRAGTPITQN